MSFSSPSSSTGGVASCKCSIGAVLDRYMPTTNTGTLPVSWGIVGTGTAPGEQAISLSTSLGAVPSHAIRSCASPFTSSPALAVLNRDRRGRPVCLCTAGTRTATFAASRRRVPSNPRSCTTEFASGNCLSNVASKHRAIGIRGLHCSRQSKYAVAASICPYLDTVVRAAVADGAMATAAWTNVTASGRSLRRLSWRSNTTSKARRPYVMARRHWTIWRNNGTSLNVW